MVHLCEVELDAIALCEGIRLRALVAGDGEPEPAVVLDGQVDVPDGEDGCETYEAHERTVAPSPAPTRTFVNVVNLARRTSAGFEVLQFGE